MTKLLVVVTPLFLFWIMGCGAFKRDRYPCMMYSEKFLMQVEIDLVDCLIKLCWKLLVSKEDIIVFLSLFINELAFFIQK